MPRREAVSVRSAPRASPGVTAGNVASRGHGALGVADALELKALKKQIERQAGFFCDAYKEKCFRRRVAVRMRARGVHRYAEYAALLARDPTEYQRLLAAVTINVSKFFRNADVWDVLRKDVVPGLFAPAAGEVRIWSAGCAAGEEAYSLAILLLEHAARHDMMHRLRRFRILGTDVDPGALEAADRAEYGDLALAETPATIRERWFLPGPPYRPRDEVRRLVRFAALDLLTDRLPEAQHVIVCRNVLIYFERTVQEKLLTRLADALVPGGVLVLGKAEMLPSSLAAAFQVVAHRERVFRRT